MSKTYDIKSSERLFNRWLQISAQTNTRLEAHTLFQNNITLSSDELNGWYAETKKRIEETQEDFDRIISDLNKLLDDSIKHIKESN